MAEAPDRGAHHHVHFTKCERGFMLSTSGPWEGSLGRTYAFDRIEDLAAWFVEQYGDEPEKRIRFEGAIAPDQAGASADD